MSQLPMFFAGVGWASEKHDVWVINAEGKRLGYKIFAHSGEGLAAMCAWLIAVTGAEPGQLNVVGHRGAARPRRRDAARARLRRLLDQSQAARPLP